MKVKLQKSVRFQELDLTDDHPKGEDWRELLLVEKTANISDEENENDDREEEWIPATSKVTVIQRDAPPEAIDEVTAKEDEVIVETYLAVVKRNPNRDAGISFSRADSDSPLCIDHITTHGPFSNSDLESGMVVSAINGKYMTWSSPEEAMAELEKETTMTITAEFAPEKYYCKDYTMVLEANMEDYCGDYGVTFDCKGENLPLYVKDVKEDGPFADLLPGLKVIAIDGQFMAWESPEKAQEALNSSQSGTKHITVEANTENVNTIVQRVAFEMNEETKEVVITEVQTFTKQFPCDLRKGMTVVMLNGQVCRETSSVEELIKDAGTMWDIIAVDLNCRRVLANKETSAGETINAFCGTGALGMAALSFNAIDMCTHPWNNMITRQNAIEEVPPEDDEWGTRQLLLSEEETATRAAVGSENGLNEKEMSENETQVSSTIDEELETAHAHSSPYEELERESSNDQITIVTQNAKAHDSISASEQEDASAQVSVRSELTTGTPSDADTASATLQSDEASKKETFKPEQSLAPILSNPVNKSDASEEPPRPFFEDKRASFEFSLDLGKIEQAPTTMHSFEIQKICNEDVGLKLAPGQNGGVYIAEMKSHCKFRGTGLKSGMRIAKINGVDCPTSMRVTTSYINAVDGTLSLVVTFGARPKDKKKREIFFSSY